MQRARSAPQPLDPETLARQAAYAEGAPEPSSWRAIPLSHYLDGAFKPQRPTLLRRQDGPSLLYPGRVHWLSGEPESGKSWLALMATSEALAAQQHVTYFDFEDGPGPTVTRLLALGAGLSNLASRFHYFNPDSALSFLTRETLREGIAASSLVVIDACTEALALQGLSSKDDVDIANWLSLLPRWAAQLGACVLVLDHVNKDRESRGRWPTGSQHKLAGVDGAAFAVERMRDDLETVRLRTRIYLTKDRHGEVRARSQTVKNRNWVGDLVIDVGEEGWRVTLSGPVARPAEVAGVTRNGTSFSEQVVAVLAEEGAPMSVRLIRKGVPGRAADVDAALDELVDRGRVTVTLGLRNAKLHSLTPRD